MKKLIIIISALTTMSCSENKEIVNSLENVQYMKGWIQEDINSGMIDSTIAEYYLHALNNTEDLLIEELTN
tara:strand:- start:502 stop:714 length:213 start_codon:yes stop_codon:yes gene_type:complete